MFGKHAPLPWVITGQSEGGRYITIKAANGRTVARVPWSPQNDGQPTDDDDAKIIVQAVNNYTALVTAVEQCANGLRFAAARNPARAAAYLEAEANLRATLPKEVVS